MANIVLMHVINLVREVFPIILRHAAKSRKCRLHKTYIIQKVKASFQQNKFHVAVGYFLWQWLSLYWKYVVIEQIHQSVIEVPMKNSTSSASCYILNHVETSALTKMSVSFIFNTNKKLFSKNYRHNRIITFLHSSYCLLIISIK